MSNADQLAAIELRLRHTAAHQRLTEDQMDARKLVKALQRALLTLESHPDSNSICLEDIEAILNE